MADLLTFEEFLTISDTEIDNLLDEYELSKQDRARTQHAAFHILPPYPQLVIDCVEYLRANNSFLKEGIFRQNGDAKAVERIREAYESGLEDVLSEVANIDAYDVATALKAYFRVLDHPLIPEQNYENMKDIVDSEDDLDTQVAALEAEVGKIVSPNKEVLCYVMKFLKEVAAHSERNKMTPKNLGTCLTMSLTRFEAKSGSSGGGGGSMLAMVEVGLSVKILSLFIDGVNFGRWLDAEAELDMRSKCNYDPKNRLSNLNKADSQAQHSVPGNNKAAANKQNKPKVPPRIPPRQGRPTHNPNQNQSSSQKKVDIFDIEV